MRLPIEIIEQILLYCDFEQIAGLSDYVAHKIYNPVIHTYEWAVRNGHTDVIKYLYKNNKPRIYDNLKSDAYLLLLAVELNRFEIVKWIHENETEIRGSLVPKIADKAAEYCCIDILRYLYKQRLARFTIRAMKNAAINNYLEVIKWLHKNTNADCDKNVMDRAAEHGHIKVVKWLHKNRTEGCTAAAIDNAAKNGHFKVVKWLYKNRNEGCTALGIYYATKNNHIEIANWLKKNSGICDDVINVFYK